MMPTNPYSFRRVLLDDLALLETWLSRPHVREWWEPDRLYDERDLADPRVRRWIVSFEGRPFAFMQDYSVHGWENHHFASLPIGSRGIDQYIGDPGMVGVGHGSAFIKQRVQFLFEEGAPVVATDPHPDNKRAMSVYKKLGFQEAGAQQETEWGLIVPMLAWRQADVAE